MAMYNCVLSILESRQDLLTQNLLQLTLVKETTKIGLESLIRPFILSICSMLKNQGNLCPKLVTYFENSQLDYSTHDQVFTHQEVGKRCREMLQKLFPKMLYSLDKQINRTDGQLWGLILRSHSFHAHHWLIFLLYRFYTCSHFPLDLPGESYWWPALLRWVAGQNLEVCWTQPKNFKCIFWKWKTLKNLS